jgi:hypothetical protein
VSRGLCRIRFGFVGQRAQGLQAVGDVFQGNRLQLGTPAQDALEGHQRLFDRFAALRQAVQETRTVEVADARHTGRVGLRLQVAPFGELGQCRLDCLDAGRRRIPPAFGQHLVGPHVQAELAFGRSECLHHAAVERCFFGADMPEQIGQPGVA